ncbi:MAG: SCO family protein [Oligoflexales bacterium]|nr:SCO family protein [Oligoflexales bacterium]
MHSKVKFHLLNARQKAAHCLVLPSALAHLLSVFVLLLSGASQLSALPKMSAPMPDPERTSSTIAPEQLKQVGLDEKLGQTLDFSGLTFKNEEGKSVELAEFFSAKKPVVLVLAYYGCENICNILLNGVSSVVRSQDWTIGKEFEIVTVSFDARNTPEEATAKKDFFIKEYGRMGAERGWHFLTGEEAAIKALTQQVGFRYIYDESTDQFAHSSAMIFLTPEGKISRYLHGVQFKPQDVRLALIESGEGKVGTFIEQALMFCFRYDPNKGGYAALAFNIVQYSSIMVAIFLFSYLFWFWGREIFTANA